ncbi:MAG: RNA-binding protein [Candidatus Omnitrophica bacterium]|nr:RNA-binding protein [Candidatus Omnitrophota bacterium]
MQESNNENKIYVGNLEYSTTEDELREAFSQKGVEIKEVRIVKDKFTGRSKGFGFAQVDSQEEMDKAISSMDGQDLKGRKLRVSKARERKLRRDFRPRRFENRSF